MKFAAIERLLAGRIHAERNLTFADEPVRHNVNKTYRAFLQLLRPGLNSPKGPNLSVCRALPRRRRYKKYGYETIEPRWRSCQIH